MGRSIAIEYHRAKLLKHPGDDALSAADSPD
jgi:hypothetical protein